ncbi:hypothetical protein PS838_02204 [Pseudomonas fluorescens]|jgi:hypothetical protein|nr:hypothetical protein PS903_01548 [Pseudomonas fluorescens]VVO88947.1 hypothetical protein PS838_02204 [Pseudomonas fluorescens]
MGEFLKSIGLSRKGDFASKVLERYNSKKTVSSFARTLFNSESAESINARFAKAKHKVAK